MSEPSNISHLEVVVHKSDAEVAAEFKDRIAEAIEPLLKEIAAAKRAGFQMHFTIGDDAFGRPTLTCLKVIKEY